MAQKVTVPGTDVVVKPRNPVGVGFLSLTIVYLPYWTAYTTSERIKTAQMATGRKDWWEGWIALLVLLLLPPLLFGFVQDQLNKVWQNLGIDTPYPKTELPPPPGYGYQYPQQQQGGYQQPQPYQPPERPQPPDSSPR